MLTFSLRSGFLRKNSRLQGKKRSKIGHLASIFDAAGVDFYQKYCRKADCQHALGRLKDWKDTKRPSETPFSEFQTASVFQTA